MFKLNTFLCFAGAVLSLGAACLVLLKGNRSFAFWAFTFGMIALALDQGVLGFSFLLSSPSELIFWHRLRSVFGAVLLPAWLLFSLSFARANYEVFLTSWKWVVLVLFAMLAALSVFFGDSFFLSATAVDGKSAWLLVLGWSGYAYQVFSLLGAVAILMNLEKTLRAFTGSMRWKIKPMALGLFGLFAVRVYTTSQMLLYHTLNPSLESLNGAAIIVASVLIALSFYRMQVSDASIYLSHTAVYNSLTVLIIGVYLIVTGVVAGSLSSFENTLSVPLEVLFIFVSLMALAFLVFSSEIRQRFKYLLNRHFSRPRYDYRKEWSTFTQRTLSLVDTKELCAAAAKMISDTFGSPSVTIWLLDEARNQLNVGGSTALLTSQAQIFDAASGSLRDFVCMLRDQSSPVDLNASGIDWRERLKADTSDVLVERKTAYIAPLAAAGEFVGFVTVGARISSVPFTLEDIELLKTMADQTAGSILNLRLNERLQTAKQLETFQTISTFFVHDLKNLASTLSLTLQNLPVHYDNPEFREDALKVIGRSVDKINSMCRRLVFFKEKVEINRTEVNLNALIEETIGDLNGSVRSHLHKTFNPIAPLLLDPDQIHKVVTNLILNAEDAVGDEGRITIETSFENGCAVLSVTDNGCGMSRNFMECSLFSPFKTTKKKGLGIGLFQCRMIVEAHQGKIEVESLEGKGSTFRVILPFVPEFKNSSLG